MSQTLLEPWFTAVNQDPSLFTINIKDATPLLQVLPTQETPASPEIDCVEELDLLYNMLSAFVEELVKDALLTNVNLKVKKGAADQVYTFIQRSNKCLKLLDMAENHPSSFPLFQYQLFLLYHKMTKGWR